MKVSRAAKIRNYLEALPPTERNEPGAAQVRKIASAIGEDPLCVGHTLGVLLREGRIGRRGPHHFFEYYFISHPPPRKTPEERRAVDNARARRNYKPKPRVAKAKVVLPPTPPPKARPLRMQEIQRDTREADVRPTESLDAFLARGGKIERL
jgi:hypothetical protein